MVWYCRWANWSLVFSDQCHQDSLKSCICTWRCIMHACSVFLIHPPCANARNELVLTQTKYICNMHQSFVSPAPGTGDSGNIAGLKCRGLTCDVSRQCRGCAGVLTSRQYSGDMCVSGYKFNKVGNKGVCRNCNVCKVCPLPLLYATFADIFGLCQHLFLSCIFVSNHTFKHKCLALTARTI